MANRLATERDMQSISQIYSRCFANKRDHLVWVTVSCNAYPRSGYYVVEQQGKVVVYILWSVKNGFMDNTIIELEPLAVAPLL